jgi:O-antigen/teichoic acid export membrane protein
LGIYGFAYKFVSDTVKALASITNAVAYPTFAKVSGELERLRSYFFGIARASMMLVGTVLVVLALHAEGLLSAVGYDQWLPSVPYIQLFSIVGVLRCVSPLVPQLLNATGQARLNFFYSLSNAIFMPAAFVIGGMFGPFGVAYAWVTAYPLVVLLLFWFGARVLEMPLSGFVLKTFSGALILPVVAGMTLAYQVGLAPMLAGWPVLSLAVGVLVTVATGLGLVWKLQGRAVLAILKKKAPPTASDAQRLDPTPSERSSEATELPAERPR